MDWLRNLQSKITRPKLPANTTVHTAPGVEIVGSQEGPGAELLERALRDTFLPLHQVQRAYLCKIRYGNETEVHVAVGVVAVQPDDPAVIEATSQVIHSLLEKGFHLDILFLNDKIEEQIARLCHPFYAASAW